MLRYTVTFTVPMADVDTYTAEDVVVRLKRIQGVTDARMYRTTTPPSIPSMGSITQQKAHYCLEIDMAQDTPMVAQVLNGMYLDNERDVADVQLRAYRQLA